MNVLLIGPPGSGKGTQGGRLSARLGLTHLSAGDLLRAEVSAGTDLGLRVRALLDRGDLVPDDVIFDLLMPRAIEASNGQGYLLDGFPRSVHQAEEAGRRTEGDDAAPQAVVYLDIAREVLQERILARAETEGRSDDNVETVANRLRVFDEQTSPLVDYYRDMGILHVVDGDADAETVTDQIVAVLATVAAPG